MILRRKRRTRETALCPLDSDENVRQLLEVADPAANPEEDCLFNDSRRIMDYAIRRLPLQLRVVAELRLVRNLSMQEIAAILNISVPATKSRLVRAKRRIAETLPRHAEPRNARKHIRNKAKAR
jgi:RNA polymerase sigma-70 factor (ECF subfamily)